MLGLGERAPYKNVIKIVPFNFRTMIHAYIHTHILTYYMCVHVYIHTCMHACINAYIYKDIHTFMHTFIHTYIHTYMCMHEYTIEAGLHYSIDHGQWKNDINR